MTIEDRIREAVDGYLTKVRQDLDLHAQHLTDEILQLVMTEQQEWSAERDRVVAEALAEGARLVGQGQDAAAAVATALQGSRQSRVETLERLTSAVRSIDESGTLTGILGALMRGTAAETSRVAILLVDGYMLRTWEHVGFEEGKGPTEMPIGAAGTLAAAVALKQASFVPTVIEGRDSTVPGFMRVPAGHTGLVVPLTVGGDVVAVLYADDVAKAVEQEDAPLWTEEVQLLARHAALALENVTSVRTVEVLAGTD
jgi:transcriptional regulator with GAF, ATPase, and Fis domain